jgi:16S rRNA (cytosine967-C5)-methyltransferase
MALLNGVSVEKPRQIAARILKKRLSDSQFTENLLEIELGLHAMAPPDRGLCQELVYGVTRWQATLDWLIARKTASRTQKEWLRILLQLGLYQMFWLDRIPDHAAVNETVEMARQLVLAPQAGFVNAILRAYARERDQTTKLLADLKAQDPALGHSHPAWLYQRWVSRWGAEKAARLMSWNNTPPRTYARPNLLKTDVSNLTARWRAEGVEFTPWSRDWLEEAAAFQLDSHPPLADLGSLREGLFYVQDPSTLLAVRELDPQPGETVLDLCAAPGGKTTLIAQRMQNQGVVVARDSQPERLQVLRENCSRLGVTCAAIEATTAIAGSGQTRAGAKFDRILVDAPCSNTGVMRRRVDLRWRIRPEEIERLKKAQLELLGQAAAELKPGGTLVYSTCSLESEENDEVVGEFLRSRSAFKLERRAERLPFADEVDGAFVALMTAGPA